MQNDINDARGTAKVILTDIDELLKELTNEMRMIDDSINGKKPDVEEINEPSDDCLLSVLCRQRETTGRLLNKAVHIREGLW